jgi:selenide,water dikinase
LVGLSAPDDAAVYRLNDQQAIIATTDFFPPVVDDPYAFGAIAAANALSDVYAMGGEVLFAINLAAFPDNLELAILTEILHGGADKVREAGAAIAGGHTIMDKEPKYGLAVTGIINPARIIAKGGAQPGDGLILTKPLGTGVITTALKRGEADSGEVATAIASMTTLNRAAAQAAQAAGVHAMTDITGYSLIGHAHEMAHLSKADFTLSFSALPWLPGAQRYAELGAYPGGTARNVEYFSQWTTFDAALDEPSRLLCYDPQTSGGLLIAVAPDKSDTLMAALTERGERGWHIGQVNAGTGRIRITYSS